jgi:hypothetical protein
MYWKIYLTLGLSSTYPFSTSLISYTITMCHLFSIYVLKHSTYLLKFNFQMFLCTFLYYFYLETYPHSNVTLTNLVFMSFTAYQLFHNLFKFSFQFELIVTQIGNGNVSAVLPARIQNVLQTWYVDRQLLLRRQQAERHRLEVQRLQE